MLRSGRLSTTRATPRWSTSRRTGLVGFGDIKDIVAVMPALVVGIHVLLPDNSGSVTIKRPQLWRPCPKYGIVAASRRLIPGLKRGATNHGSYRYILCDSHRDVRTRTAG